MDNPIFTRTDQFFYLSLRKLSFKIFNQECKPELSLGFYSLQVDICPHGYEPDPYDPPNFSNQKK